LTLNAHLFRHVCAFLYLKAHPGRLRDRALAPRPQESSHYGASLLRAGALGRGTTLR
jgi:hypothetical protein